MTGSACSHGMGRISLSPDNTKVKEEILKQVPLGSSMEHAQKIMLEDGFQCTMMLNERFIEQENHFTKATHEGIDYLYCDKEKGKSFFCSQRWQIAIVRRNNVVADILVSYGTICV